MFHLLTYPLSMHARVCIKDFIFSFLSFLFTFIAFKLFSKEAFSVASNLKVASC